MEVSSDYHTQVAQSKYMISNDFYDYKNLPLDYLLNIDFNSAASNSLTKDSLIFPSTSRNGMDNSRTSRDKKLINKAAFDSNQMTPSGLWKLNSPLQEAIVKRRTIFPPKNLQTKDTEIDGSPGT
jgi:hypothetical protein